MSNGLNPNVIYPLYQYQAFTAPIVPTTDINANDGVAEIFVPPGTHILAYDKETGFYLTKTHNFTLPPKLYGNVIPAAQKIFTAYMKRNRSTGVLFDGMRGTGKTLTAKFLCTIGLYNDIPVIIVNAKYTSLEFIKYLLKIQQRVIIFLDEFEKDNMYPSPQDQNVLLTVLDGAFSSNKLFILVANETSRITPYLKDRPSRIYYRYEYGKLSDDIIKEYVLDNGLSEELAKEIIDTGSVIPTLNFDILQSIIDNIKMFDSTVKEAIETMYISGEAPARKYKLMELIADNELIDIKNVRYTEWTIDLHGKNGNIDVQFTMEDGDKKYAWFKSGDIVNLDTEAGTVELRSKDSGSDVYIVVKDLGAAKQKLTSVINSGAVKPEILSKEERDKIKEEKKKKAESKDTPPMSFG